MRKSFNFEPSISSDNPMTADEFGHAERLLARLIAAAYTSDHPEAIGIKGEVEPIMGEQLQTRGREISGAGLEALKSGGAHAENE
jgi:hypothetical protein